MKSYKVVEFGKPLQKVEEANPAPQGSEVLVRITAAGVCHSDVHLWEGYFDMGGGNKYSTEKTMAPPRTMGHEIVGEVAAVGPSPRAPRSATKRWSIPGSAAANAGTATERRGASLPDAAGAGRQQGRRERRRRAGVSPRQPQSRRSRPGSRSIASRRTPASTTFRRSAGQLRAARLLPAGSARPRTGDGRTADRCAGRRYWRAALTRVQVENGVHRRTDCPSSACRRLWSCTPTWARLVCARSGRDATGAERLSWTRPLRRPNRARRSDLAAVCRRRKSAAPMRARLREDA